jgi:small subunit ribosomal protein S17
VKAIQAKVLKTKMDKTAVVVVTSAWSHPLYQKIVRRSKKFLVHDTLGVKPNDTVLISEVRPISKNKHYTITKIMGKESQS